MTMLTSTEQIEDFLQAKLLVRLSARRRSIVMVWFLVAVDKLLMVVPFPLRKAVVSFVAMRPPRTIWGLLRSAYFWFVTLFFGVVFAMVSLLVLVPLGRAPLVVDVIEASVVSLLVALFINLWSNAFRVISHAEASATQGFCSTPERASIVSGWIARWGMLRAMDAAFVQKSFEDYKREYQRLLSELSLVGEASPDVSRPSLSSRVAARAKGVFEALYGGNRFTRDKVSNTLRQGELGKHLDHAILDHDTPKAISQTPKPRL